MKLLNIILSRTFRIYELEEANRRLQRQTGQGGSLCGMLGISPAMGRLFERIRQVSGTDYPALITRDSGTGKEMAARAVHNLSSRAQRPLVIINCGAIPENLLESELFGHEKGAFTGAAGRKIGRFEQADKGTVFLDEIGELSLALQVKILRFLQEGTVERVGGDKDHLAKCPHHCSHQHQSGRCSQGREIPRRPLLPDKCRSSEGTLSEGASGRHPPSDTSLS